MKRLANLSCRQPRRRRRRRLLHHPVHHLVQQDLAVLLFHESRRHKPFRLEDVFATGLLAAALNESVAYVDLYDEYVGGADWLTQEQLNNGEFLVAHELGASVRSETWREISQLKYDI